MPQLLVHGLDVYYREEGSGPPVVLGHSSTASSGQWRELFKQISNRYHVFGPDHVGYGRTGAYPGGIPLMELEIAIIETLQLKISEPAHLVGHSFGGGVLTRAAVRMPERVRSLTLYEPTLLYLLAPNDRTSEDAEIKAIADRVSQCVRSRDYGEATRVFIDHWVGPGAYDGLGEKQREAIRAGMDKVQLEWPTAFEPCGATMEALSSLRIPVQLLSGSQTTPAARAVIDILRGIWPTARHFEVSGAGHMGALTHHGLVNQTIDHFISGLA